MEQSNCTVGTSWENPRIFRMKFTIKDSKSIADFMTSQDFDRNNQWIQSEVTEMNSNAYV